MVMDVFGCFEDLGCAVVKLEMVQFSFGIIILCFICHCSLASTEDWISCHLLFHVVAHSTWIL